MQFREILVKDVRLNVERTFGLVRIIIPSILWGANFVYKYSEYFFFRATSSAIFSFLWSATLFSMRNFFRHARLFPGKLRKPVPGCRVTDLPNTAKLTEGCKDLRISHPRTFT